VAPDSAPAGQAGCRLWFDVEDLFEYAMANRRPSGIQRVAFEIFRALQQDGGERIGFLRHDPLREGFRPVAWTTVAGLFDQLTETAPVAARSRAAPRQGGIAPEPPWRLRLRRLVYRLPLDLRQPALQAVRSQWQAVQAGTSLLRAMLRHGAAALAAVAKSRPMAATAEADAADFAALVRPGDVLVVLGAPWSSPDYAGLLARAKTRFGLRFAILVFDIIPIRRPEWCERGLVRLFRAWFTAVLPHADIVMAISRATAADVEQFAAASGIALRAPVRTIPMGSGFALAATSRGARAGLPLAGSYALCVATIEARKNHTLLFRVWRRLLDDLPREQVPTLVFAGRVGWLVADLMQQLENSDYLDGKIRLIEDASDPELAALYRGCLFTVFPSLYEGWGLPVTESLAFGKPCVAARGSSLPEAGGTLVRYLDPDSASDAYTVIRAVIEDPDGLRAWQAEVVRSFVPVAWADTAMAIWHEVIEGHLSKQPARAASI
jgi:glycosyltransferase involved in cell wall biosynthesis